MTWITIKLNMAFFFYDRRWTFANGSHHDKCVHHIGGTTNEFYDKNPRFIFQMAFFTAAHLLVDSDWYTNFHKTYVFWVQTIMEIVFLKNVVLRNHINNQMQTSQHVQWNSDYPVWYVLDTIRIIGVIIKKIMLCYE